MSSNERVAVYLAIFVITVYSIVGLTKSIQNSADNLKTKVESRLEVLNNL